VECNPLKENPEEERRSRKKRAPLLAEAARGRLQNPHLPAQYDQGAVEYQQANANSHIASLQRLIRCG
jgi:hypothetical protein